MFRWNVHLYFKCDLIKLEHDMQGKTFFSLYFCFQMPNHYDLDCPTAPIPCTFSTFGCHEKVRCFFFFFLLNVEYRSRKFSYIVQCRIPVGMVVTDMHCVYSLKLQREIRAQNIDLGRFSVMLMGGVWLRSYRLSVYGKGAMANSLRTWWTRHGECTVMVFRINLKISKQFCQVSETLLFMISSF